MATDGKHNIKVCFTVFSVLAIRPDIIIIRKMLGKGKVNCPLVQALRLCTGRAAHRGSRGTAILFHDQLH